MSKLLQTLRRMRGGVHPEFHKEAATQHKIQTLEIPPQLIIPIQQTGNSAPRLLVAVGDKVLKGQALTELRARSAASITHASSSGVVSAIDERALPHPSGLPGLCVIIDTDGLDQWVEVSQVKTKLNASISDQGALDLVKNLAPSDVLKRIESAGVVGLGGAAFPTAVKLAAAGQQKIKTLIVNAAECEPYISCDDALIRERAQKIIVGIKLLMQLLQIPRCLIGIEDNKPDAIEALNIALCRQRDADFSIDVKVIATQYPSGDARQLTRLLTGLEIPKGQHSLESGVLCHNIATIQAVYEVLILAKPLLSRIVTVTGDGISQPRNVEALIGTPVNFIVEQLGGYTNKAERMIMGGPMMGFALPTDELPIVKASNCILVTSVEQLQLASQAIPNVSNQVMPCIRCNKCAQVCPVSLLPQQLYWHARAHDFDKAIEHKLSDCIECGACSYVCPSYIPLVDYFKFAKTEIKSQQYASVKSSQSRERFEFNTYRKARNKQERDEKRRLHKEALMKKKAEEAATVKAVGDEASPVVSTQQATEQSVKQDAIKAAMARAKAKKAAIKAAESKGGQDAV